ncbi:MAG: response regulator [Melioribacter sp.]|nr:response regulator [Melioribacter sp.]
MKLNAKLILFAFIVVAVTSSVSAIIYYSLTNELFERYQSQSILNSANDFTFVFETSLQQSEYDFRKISNSLNKLKNINIDSINIDFIFTLENDSLINFNQFVKSKAINLNVKSRSLKKFFEDNPNLILNYKRVGNEIYYYGKFLDYNYLNKISEKIRADIALVINDELFEISNPDKNQKFIPILNKSIQNLKFKNNYDLYTVQYENSDFIAVTYKPNQLLIPEGKINFIIFSSFNEAANFRTVLRNVIFLIVIAGATLTFIFVLVFTYKFRKQISLLSEATEVTSKGNLEHRVPVITKDEIGKLGVAFNRMLDVIQKKEEIEKQYTDFIKLINQNPTLKEVSEAAIKKIATTTKCSFGLLYTVEGNSLRLVSSYGIRKESRELNFSTEIHSNVILNKEYLEFYFNENYPEIKTGLTSIKIKYLLIYPILYNKEVVAIIELASENIPCCDVKSYLNSIQEHLAIGIVNAITLERLENYVEELKKLNEEYQKQNEQISKQNEQLKELHNQLREKANELEKQRLRAEELTKVKSQFLANMSHELRTPLISILGLTELLIKENYINKEWNERLNIIYRNGKKLLRLITNILEFSRLESGKVDVKKEKFLLSDLIEELKQNIKGLAEEKKLKFVISTPERKSILLYTDKDKLEHILSNLLVNAVKFTEKGEVKLSVELKQNNSIKFSVEDTGPGISKDNKEEIFTEFAQIETKTSNKLGGVGLGLAICKRFVEMLGSSLELISEVGKGTKFSFELNNVVIEVREYDFLKIKDDIYEHNIDLALIAGSIESSNKLIEDYLITYNFNVITVNSANKLLELVKEKKFGVILINSKIIDGNIWQTILELRKNPSTSNTTIIIFNIMENEKVGWAPNIFDYILKPLEQQCLRRLIRNIEEFSKIKLEKVIYASSNKSELEIVKELIPSEITFEYKSSLEATISLIDYGQPQLYLIDVESFKSDALLFSSMIRQNRYTRNTNIVFVMPQNFAEEEVKDLSQTFDAITLREKNHPLDILKYIKDRLQIDDSEANKRLNLMVEYSPRKKEPIDLNYSSLKPTIMIVDDDEDTLFTLGEFIRKLDCNTIFAHNGMECLLTLNHVVPDLILLDIMMPTMDGFETIRRIRSSNRTANTPVIALTAYAMLENKEVIEKNGFNGLITKPIDLSSLAAQIKKYLKVKAAIL